MITTFHIPTKIIVGAGSFNLLGKEVKVLGRNVLLVTGQSFARKTGLLDRTLANLERQGLNVNVFDKVEPNPRSTTVDEGAKLVRNSNIEVIVALGGGSTIDTAKGMVISVAGGQPIWHYAEVPRKIKGTAPNLVVVPTVAASGSEANCAAVITNWASHEKRVLFYDYAYPTVAIVDPELTLSMPVKPTAQGGVDIFCHLL